MSVAVVMAVTAIHEVSIARLNYNQATLAALADQSNAALQHDIAHANSLAQMNAYQAYRQPSEVGRLNRRSVILRMGFGGWGRRGKPRG